MDLLEVPGAAFRRHPWEVARAAFFKRLLGDAGLLSQPRAVLDVGAGDGYLARQLLGALPAGSRLTCFDTHYTDDDLARFGSPPFPGLSFTRSSPTERSDLLLLLDVVEHVEDDRAFLGGLIRDNLAPSGSVLVSVPAWQSLYSRHDEALKHFRRYPPKALAALLADVGLVPRRSGGLFHALLFPRLGTVIGERLARLIGRRKDVPAGLGDWRRGSALSTLVEKALAADAALGRAAAAAGLPLPGLSCWALCARAEAPPA